MDSIDGAVVQKLKVEELKAELNFRRLPDAGLKPELVQRLLTDNERLVADGTQHLLIEARKKRDADQKAVEDLQQQKLRQGLQATGPGTFPSHLQDTSQAISSPLPTDVLLQVLQQLAVTQADIAKGLAQNPTVQVYSTNDTAIAIPTFSGKVTEKVDEWIREVRRIASHANWTDSLTLVNAITRLQGSALNWHKVTGRKFDSFDKWKDEISARFQYKMSLVDFIGFQAKRQLRQNEFIVDYIFDKDAIIEKAPCKFEQEDRISLIIEGITDPTWSVPLASHKCDTVESLIEHARPLDTIRKFKEDSRLKTSSFTAKVTVESKETSSQPSTRQHGFNKFIHRYNPLVDKEEDQTCYVCKKKGHISYSCPERTNETTLRASPTSVRPGSNTKTKSDVKPQHKLQTQLSKPGTYPQAVDKVVKGLDNPVLCILPELPMVTLVPTTINSDKLIDAIVDSGSVITMIRKDFLPRNIHVYPWQKGPYRVAGSIVTPNGWFTSRIQVGRIDYIMPQIAIVQDLPVPMLLGKDWQFAVYARVINEPNGDVVIMTPSVTEIFSCKKAEVNTIGCVMQHFPRKPLVTSLSELAVLPKLFPLTHSSREMHNSQTTDETTGIPVKHETLRADVHIKQEGPEKKEIVLEMTREQKAKLDSLVKEFDDIFATENEDLGEFPDQELEINLKHDKPIRCKPYRLPEPERQFLKTTVEKWIQQGICRISNSPYAAPMFVVQQPFHPTTPLRPVADYSKTINPITIPDPQPIDRMDDIVLFISQFLWKFALDVCHAYQNIKIKPKDVPKTAVVTPDYHIEFLRVMFGLLDGPAIMSRVIKATYGHLYEDGVRTYFDDVPGGAHSFDKLLQLLRKAFQATREKRLRLRKEKCIFATTELSLFGRILSPSGERPDPKRTAAVERYTTLSSVHEVRSFLGFANVFRRFIKSYAVLVRPLNELLRQKKTRSTEKKKNPTKSTDSRVVLNEVQQKAFEELKHRIVTPPILAFFTFGAPTYVETDASYEGMGACLLQEQDGERKVIEYASRSLKDPETRYHINELEVAAVHWALTEKFRIYLLGFPFTLITDNFTTAYVVNRAKLNRKFARYVIDLAAFQYTSIHRPGKENVIADHLSRYPMPQDVCLMVVTSQDSRLQAAQKVDGFSAQVIAKLSNKKESPHLSQIRKSFKLDNGILIHREEVNGHFSDKIVIPQSLRSAVLKICHDNSGHFDFESTLNRVKSKYWWKSMRSDVKAYTKACIVCAKVNRRTVLASGLLGPRPIPQTPWQIVSADHIVALPETNAGNKYILVHMDHATRYVLAKPTCSLSSSAVIDTIENDIVFTYGPPEIYISDNAPCFASQEIKRFFAKYSIEHLPSTPYTPQSNGLVERANATIIAVLKKMALEEPEEWDKTLPKAVLKINLVQHKTTHYSPFYLLHGYQPEIHPSDLKLGRIINDIDRLFELDFLSIDRAHAIEKICEQHDENKARFDLRRIERRFKTGDIVMYDWPQAGSDKLTQRFKGPYRVEHKVGSVCYRIRDVNAPSKVKLAHIQFLRLLPASPSFDEPSNVPLVNPEEKGSLEQGASSSEADDIINEDNRVQVTTTRHGRKVKIPERFQDFEMDI